jgi:hypothetical protein
LKTYCGELVREVERVERELTGDKAPDWPAIRQDFWGLWQFEPTGVAVMPVSTDRPDALGLQILHAARHGGVPVLPRDGGSLSIGQWWRLLVLYAFGDESVPPQAATAATAALGFPDEITEFKRSGSNMLFDPRPQVNLPVLVVTVGSSRSPAWSSWRPDRRALVVMPPPRDLLRRANGRGAVEPAGVRDEEPPADDVAVQDPAQVTDAFEGLKHRLLRDREPSRIRRYLMRLFPFLRAIRNVELIECEEVTRQSPAEIRQDRVYFGFGPAPVGLRRYIENPTSIGDLLEGIRRMGGLSDTLPPVAPPPLAVSVSDYRQAESEGGPSTSVRTL